MAQLRVLVIVHDDAIRTAIGEALDGEGHVTQRTREPGEGLALARALPPELIILDQSLPHLGAGEFRRAQLETAAIAPVPVVLILSGEAEVVPGTADAFLKKPFGLKELFEAVTRLTG